MSGGVPSTVSAPTENCRYCWMCRHACPVGRVTARETLTPHAWALTIESVRRGQLVWNAETAAVMYACADCGLCRSHCVTDQPLPDAIVSAREAILAAGVAPTAVVSIDERLRTYSNLYADEAPERTTGRGRVGLFVGDVGRHRAAASVQTVRRLLEAAGVHTIPLCDGRSSGLVASSLGLRTTAIALARTVVAEIEASGVSELFVSSPGDRWTFEYVYPTRLGVSWPAQVSLRDVTDELASALADGRLSVSLPPAEGTYAYHDPCHGPRIRRDSAVPRALLAALVGAAQVRECFWRETRAHPCGAIGGLEFTNPGLARDLALSRFRDAATAGAQTIVTDDPGCLVHLAEHNPGEMRTVGLYELLASRART